MKKLIYKPSGVCSKLFEIHYDNDTIMNLKVTGGCHGNLQGISSLVSGMKIKDVIKRLSGIKCGNKNTSCPDQLAQALKTIN